MLVPIVFVEPCSERSIAPAQVGTLEAPKQDKIMFLSSIEHDHLALKYIGRRVYIWKGPLKGKVGRVLSIGGTKAQLSFTGMAPGCAIHTLKRDSLMRYVLVGRIKYIYTLNILII